MDPTRNNPPVAVRIVRPFRDIDGLLAAEANVFTRTGIVLIGAPSKPSGVVLRFELCLQDGTAVMRGEGRVVGYRAPSSDEDGALMLRFTRLDVKSKELLDRAVTMREERRSLAPPSQRPATAPPRPPSVAPQSVAPPSSVSPPTDREHVPDSIPSPPPVAMSVPAPAPVADDEAMDVDDVDLQSADESDLTVQAPPVALAEQHEKMPVPQPSPGKVPAPHPIAPPTPATPVKSPEPTPQPRAPEHMPAPQRSPEPKRHASEALARVRDRAGEFRTTLEPQQRDSALDRLRKRTSRG
jgi:hypothetical protein